MIRRDILESNWANVCPLSWFISPAQTALISAYVSRANSETKMVALLSVADPNDLPNSQMTNIIREIISPNVNAALLLLLLMLHFLRRTYETLFVHKSGASKNHSMQHILVTMAGLVYYVLVILSPALGSLLLNDGKLEMSTLGRFDWISTIILSFLGIVTNPTESANNLVKHSQLWTFLTPEFIIRIFCGVMMFIFGSVSQYQTHAALAKLRKSRVGQNAENEAVGQTAQSKYLIPYGGMFEYVASPHYFAEILIYFSFFIIFPCNVKGMTAISLASLSSMFYQMWQNVINFAPTTLLRVFDVILTTTSSALPVVFIEGVQSVWRVFITIFIDIISTLGTTCPSTSFWCLIWVCSNLFITAHDTLTWYRKTFPNFPRKRKALIPYVT